MNNSKKRIYSEEFPQISLIFADKILCENLRDLRESFESDISGQILSEFENRIGQCCKNATTQKNKQYHYSMNENDISYIIRGAIFKVYNTLGPGLLESVYVAALVYELKRIGLQVKTEVPLPVVYEDERLEIGFRLDVLVNDIVIIEVKSVEQLAEIHHKVVLTYLKLSAKKLGIIVNFNTDNISKSIFRKVNKL